MVEIETAGLLLRQWQPADREQYVALMSDPAVTRYMLAMPRTRVEALSDDFLRQWRRDGFGPFAALDRATGAWVGQIGLARMADWLDADNVEVGFELHPVYWGRGLAAEGARAALRFGFEVVGLTRIISTTNPANLQSRRVMEKLGLSFQGIRQYHGHDTVWYAIDRSTWEAATHREAPAEGGR